MTASLKRLKQRLKLLSITPAAVAEADQLRLLILSLPPDYRLHRTDRKQ
jgi:hypothetical protein